MPLHLAVICSRADIVSALLASNRVDYLAAAKVRSCSLVAPLFVLCCTLTSRTVLVILCVFAPQPLAGRVSVFDKARLNVTHDGRATWDALMSSIYLAAAAGEDEVVKRLIRSGANVLVPDSVSIPCGARSPRV